MSQKTVSFYMTHSEEINNNEKPIGVGKNNNFFIFFGFSDSFNFFFFFSENIESVTRGLVDLRTKLKQISNNQHMRVEINSAHGDS